jgi:acyl carrier protein
MTGHLGEGDRARMAREGMGVLTAREGLALFDLALGWDGALLAPVRLDVAGIRARVARAGVAGVPTLLRGLVGQPGGLPRPSAAAALVVGDAADALRQKLAGRPEAERVRMLLGLVRAHAAAVLGLTSAEAVEASRPFREFGFDSLTALELRNRLNAVTGLRLPATVVFSYPTSVALAGYLGIRTVDSEADHLHVLKELDRLKSALSSVVHDSDGRFRIMTRLEAMVRGFRAGTAHGTSTADELDTATDDEMFEFADRELGISG